MNFLRGQQSMSQRKGLQRHSDDVISLQGFDVNKDGLDDGMHPFFIDWLHRQALT